MGKTALDNRVSIFPRHGGGVKLLVGNLAHLVSHRLNLVRKVVRKLESRDFGYLAIGYSLFLLKTVKK